MPAVLTHKTIMLMARERLLAIRDALRRKRLHGPTPQTDLEYRVEFLADQAYDMMSDNTLTERGVLFPEGDYTTPFGEDTSPYAVMGSMGPDITAFSALLAPGQAWVFDTIHKGNPDANRELVVAKTTDFVISFWSKVLEERAAGRCTDDDVRNMRAYALGHLCHIAGDVISHPFINDLEWHLGNRTREKLEHGGGEGSIDARVAQKMFLRQSTRDGQAWDKWWPTSDEVPGVFYASYTSALDTQYQALSTANRPRGFGRFEERFVQLKAPAFDDGFVKDGYSVYRHGIVSIGYGWGYGSWFGALTPVFVPLSLAIGLSGALPHSRKFFTDDFANVGERAWFEVLTLPLAVSTIVPVIYGIWLATLTTRSVEGLTGAGIAFSIVNLILAVIFFSTVGTDIPWWARWFFIFIPMLAIPTVFAAIGGSMIDRRKTDGTAYRGGLALIYGTPAILWAVFAVCFFGIVIIGALVPLLLTALVELLAGGSGTGVDVVAVIFYVLGMLVLTALMIFAWIVLPPVLRDAKIPDLPTPFSSDNPHFVRLFDDTTLGHDPAVANPTSRQLFYPSERRSLIKLWWTGAGDLWVRSEQRQVAFSTTGTGAPSQRVQAPVTPMTAMDYAEFLEATVPGLKAKLVYDDATRETFLPPGNTFSQELGDEDHGPPEALAQFIKLAKAEADATYHLRHADKPYQAVLFGQRGTVESGTPQDEHVRGAGTVTSSGTTVTGTGTLFTYYFDPGDQIVVGTQVRVVATVTSDTQLTLVEAFTPNVAAASQYLRLGPDELLLKGAGQVTASKFKVTGTGTRFKSFFSPGDQIIVGAEARGVVKVVSNTELELQGASWLELQFSEEARRLKLEVTTASDYFRLGAGRERTEGYPYLSSPATAQAVGGGSIMDFAADFAALLCMGMAPHLLPGTARKVPALHGRTLQGGGAASEEVGKVYQVFRNWSLDRRRLNEWRMIVAGGARSEKATSHEYDSSMLQPQPPASDWTAPEVAFAGAAEPALNAEGWVPVLRQWMARVTTGAAMDATPPATGGPTNLALSQALAYLLDLKPPTNLAPP